MLEWQCESVTCHQEMSGDTEGDLRCPDWVICPLLPGPTWFKHCLPKNAKLSRLKQLILHKIQRSCLPSKLIFEPNFEVVDNKSIESL